MWIADRGMVFPFGPASQDYSLPQEEAEELLRELGGLLIRWTDGFGDDKSNDWYAVICDTFRTTDTSARKIRWEIRRGLQHCHAERVDANYVADNGPAVNVDALRSHRFSDSEVREFRARAAAEQEYSDIIHYWGIFHRGQFIGYSKNLIFGAEEAAYSTIRVREDHQKSYASYSLIYRMNEYYLEEAKMKYVNDGFRNIHHQTNIQNFLIKKFGFRHAQTNLSAAYKPWLRMFLRATQAASSLLRLVSPKVRALYLIEEVRRSCQDTKVKAAARTLSTSPQQGGRRAGD